LQSSRLALLASVAPQQSASSRSAFVFIFGRRQEALDAAVARTFATEFAKEALGEEGQKAFALKNPLQRIADPAEIGAVAAFLASQDSSFMTASEVAVDGGLAQI
jgi:NAD(P)-dependent dehydrogenase (short-subunit alcohol dehydrogenase family)